MVSTAAREGRHALSDDLLAALRDHREPAQHVRPYVGAMPTVRFYRQSLIRPRSRQRSCPRSMNYDVFVCQECQG